MAGYACPNCRGPIQAGMTQCPQCGTMLAPMMATAPPSARWSAGKIIAVIIAVVILVPAIMVFAAAILYLGVSQNLGGGPTSPTMSWTGATQTSPGGDDWEFRIASIDQSVSFGNYRVSILQGTSIVAGPDDLAAGNLVLGTAGGTHLNVTDLAGDGRLNGGDTFILGNAEPDQTYRLVVYWKASGNEIGRKTVNT